MMKIVTFCTAVVVLCFLESPASAQNAPYPHTTYPLAPFTMVQSAEVNLGHTVCGAYLHTGLPAYFVLKTTRLDIFWTKLPEIKKCLLQVKMWIDNPKKYHNHMMLLPEIPGNISPPPSLSSMYKEIRCNQVQGENVRATLTEFSFPYLIGKDDIAEFLKETNLRICIHSMRPTDLPSSSDWGKNS